MINLNDEFINEDILITIAEEQRFTELLFVFFDYIFLGIIICFVFTLIYIRVLYFFI